MFPLKGEPVRALTTPLLIVFSRMLKKAIHGFFQLRNRKSEFCDSSQFQHVHMLKLTMLPCIVRRLPKNRVFNSLLVTA